MNLYAVFLCSRSVANAVLPMQAYMDAWVLCACMSHVATHGVSALGARRTWAVNANIHALTEYAAAGAVHELPGRTWCSTTCMGEKEI